MAPERLVRRTFVKNGSRARHPPAARAHASRPAGLGGRQEARARFVPWSVCGRGCACTRVCRVRSHPRALSTESVHGGAPRGGWRPCSGVRLHDGRGGLDGGARLSLGRPSGRCRPSRHLPRPALLSPLLSGERDRDTAHRGPPPRLARGELDSVAGKPRGPRPQGPEAAGRLRMTVSVKDTCL